MHTGGYPLHGPVKHFGVWQGIAAHVNALCNCRDLKHSCGGKDKAVKQACQVGASPTVAAASSASKHAPALNLFGMSGAVAQNKGLEKPGGVSR